MSEQKTIMIGDMITVGNLAEKLDTPDRKSVV